MGKGAAVFALLAFVAAVGLVGCAKSGTTKQAAKLTNGPAPNPKAAVDTRSIDALVGTKAGDWTLQDTTGKTWTLSELKGNIVVLHSWATWCVPCKQAMPGIDKVNKQFRGKGLYCFGIVNQGPEADAEILDTVARYKFSFPTLWHADKVIGKGTPYPIPVWPTMYIIDRKGVIRVVHAAGITEQVLRDDLKKLGLE